MKSLVRVSALTGLILLIPFIGMRVSDSWNWTMSDFVIIAVLLFTTGMVIELVRTQVKNGKARLALIGGIILTCMYIWAELAVGIFFNFGS